MFDASKWLRREAEQEHAMAQRDLGLIYEIYFHNRQETYMWYYIAYLSGEDRYLQVN